MRSGTGRWLAATAALGLAGCLAAPPDRAVSGDDAAAPSDAGGGDAAAPFDLLPSGLPSSTGQLGDDDGGSPYDLLCPPGRFVTGLASAQNGFGLTRLRASCSRLQLVADGESELIDSVYTAPVGSDGDAEEIVPVDCSPGLIVVGYQGSLNGNDLVSHLALQCAPVEWAPGPTMAEASETTPELGDPDAYPGGGMCDAGRAAAGIAGQSGLLVDSFRLECFALEARPAG